MLRGRDRSVICHINTSQRDPWKGKAECICGFFFLPRKPVNYTADVFISIFVCSYGDFFFFNSFSFTICGDGHAGHA